MEAPEQPRHGEIETPFSDVHTLTKPASIAESEMVLSRRVRILRGFGTVVEVVLVTIRVEFARVGKRAGSMWMV